MFVGTAFATGAQADPLVEWETVKLPATSRSSLTQCGAAIPASVVPNELVPVSVRPCEATPLPAETTAKACAEPGSRVSRIMTPALAQACVFCTLSTLAIIVPGPVRVLYAKWN